jgi:hypothetical protein
VKTDPEPSEAQKGSERVGGRGSKLTKRERFARRVKNQTARKKRAKTRRRRRHGS